jgi:hypothetical protein
MASFVLSEDGKNLPGDVTVDVENVEATLDADIKRLESSYAVYDAATKTTTYGEWFTPINRDEILTAIQTALAQA